MTDVQETARAAVVRLRRAGTIFEKGLTDREVARVERRFGFSFPPDLRALLQIALPVSEGWPDWRDGDESAIQKRIDWPLDGILFDIDNGSYWDSNHWGRMPERIDERKETVRRLVASAATLIPIVGHRYLPDKPCVAGNPVLSVYQTDIIYYGHDLEDYILKEFRVSGDPDIRSNPAASSEPRYISFWSDIVEAWDR